MYYAYLRLINRKPNYDWLRNMYYNPGQQVMRQDPLDDEREDDYTMILLGMHRHIQAWHEVLTAHGRSTGALVHRIRDDMFTPDDEKQFDTRRIPQPC